MVRFGYFAMVCLLGAVPSQAQAVVESAILGAAGSTAAAAGVKGAGAASAGVFEALRKTLEAAKPADGKAGQVQVISLATASPEAKLAVQPRDVSGITVGLTRQELIDKYGQPALKTSEPWRDQLVEAYTYMQGKNDPVMVTLRDGVVTAKTVAFKSAKQTASVVTLQ